MAPLVKLRVNHRGRARARDTRKWWRRVDSNLLRGKERYIMVWPQHANAKATSRRHFSIGFCTHLRIKNIDFAFVWCGQTIRLSKEKKKVNLESEKIVTKNPLTNKDCFRKKICCIVVANRQKLQLKKISLWLSLENMLYVNEPLQINMFVSFSDIQNRVQCRKFI